MAFVNRSKREQIIKKLSSTSSNPALGPGSQNPHNIYKKEYCNAPFNSSTIRNNSSSTGNITQNPGPGEYANQKIQIGDTSNIYDKKRMAHQFSSKIPRFEQDKSTCQTTPGPGSYDQNKTNVNKSSELSQKAPDYSSINWLRLPSAPSIPAGGQVFGYEEAPNGDLIMQKNPDKIQTGISKDSVGPGHYNLKQSLIKEKAGTHWSKQKTTRQNVQPFNATDQFVGPGTYTTEKNSEVISNQKLKETSVFASNVARDQKFKKNPNKLAKMNKHMKQFSNSFVEDEQNDEEQINPGPGQYESQNQNNIKSKYKPERLQFFGSTAERFKTTKACIPNKIGPGSYNPTNSNDISTRLGLEVSASQKINVKKVPFTQLSKRFNIINSKKNLGPGTYASETMIDNLEKKVWGKQGVFGSTEKRFVQIKDKIHVPGPGSYTDVENSNSKPRFRNKEYLKKSSNFKSNVTRENCIKISEVPGPGMQSINEGIGNYREYKAGTGNPLMSQIGDNKKKEIAFYSNQERFMNNPERDAILGPSYNPEKIPPPGQQETSDLQKSLKEKINPYSKAGFGSISNRFVIGKVKSIPGPGDQYEHDQLSRQWSKKSYNMLFAEQ